MHKFITNSQRDKLPVGLIAQSVEHCTSIAEIMSGNVVQAYFLVSGLNSTAAYDVYATEMIFHDCILFWL